MKKKLIIFLIVLAILSFCVILFSDSINGKKIQTISNPYLTINNTRINLTIADTPAKQIQGLSYQPSLEKDTGMLFIFSDKQVRNFWMKDMNFPLDIVWLDDNKIVKIDANLPAEGEQPKNSYSSIFPINRVLEVNAGFCESNHTKIGDEIKYFL